MKLPFGLILVTVASVAGCAWSPCGKSWSTSATWTEPGLFEAFPLEGKRAGYEVDYWHEHDDVDPDPVKGGTPRPTPDGWDVGNVTRKQATSLDGDWRRVAVDPDDLTRWSVSAYDRRSDDWTRAELERTFDDLGLPLTTGAASTFQWGDNGC